MKKKRKPLEIIFATDGIDEAFHVMVDIKNEVVQRWAVFNNETQEILGEPGEGTSIDFDEPFVIRCISLEPNSKISSILVICYFRIGCDPDGWALKVNSEPEYNSFLHVVKPEYVKTIKFHGQAEINFIGFGPKDMTAAPEVGNNITYVCPEGQVFNHDWFATPFVMMTCQV